MKKLSNLLAALVFVSLVVFISCSSDDGGDPAETDPRVTQSALIDGTWSLVSVTTDNGPADAGDGTWDNFELTLSQASDPTTGGSFSTDGVPTGFERVWQAEGTYSFPTNAGTTIQRSNDNIIITLTNFTEAGTGILSFSVSQEGRTSGIGGSWSFNMTKN